MHGGPNFHSTAIPTAYNGEFTLIAAEPPEDNGSGEGPNPMEYGIMSVPVCEHEESNLIAHQEGLIVDWKNANWTCDVDVDLSGYIGADVLRAIQQWCNGNLGIWELSPPR